MTVSRRASSLAAVAIMLSVLTVIGTIDFPSRDRNGSALLLPPDVVVAEAVTAKLEGNFRVDTFNVRRGKGNDDVRDLNRAAGVLKGADFVGVQEVSGTLFYGWRDQAEQLASSLGLGYVFAPTTYKWLQPYMGSAFLSRYEVQSWKIEQLPKVADSPGNARNLITATVDINGRGVTFLVTHLDRHETNAVQLDFVLKRFRQAPGPVILTADLNADRGTTAIRSLLREKGVKDAILNSIGEFWRVDWIITRGFDVIGGGYTPRGISDHAHYWVELSLSEDKK